MWRCIRTVTHSLAWVDVYILLLHIFLRLTKISDKGKDVVP